MGKAGRIACIFTPYVLTIASLICIIIVGLGCTKSSDSNLSNLYFMRVSLLSTDLFIFLTIPTNVSALRSTSKTLPARGRRQYKKSKTF